MFDIVYVVKNNITSKELIYSLRSVEKNFPYNKIYIYGGEVPGIRVDGQVSFQQEGNSKAERVANSLIKVCNSKDITDDFWLFNDDFFVINPMKEYTPLYFGTLTELANRMEHKKGRSTIYTRRTRKTGEWLTQHGYSQLNYCIHVPMLINKEKALPILQKFKDYSFKGLYGNIYNIGGVEQRDVKIVIKNKELDPILNSVYVSTNDTSFNNYTIGNIIREQFKTPSKYEIR